MTAVLSVFSIAWRRRYALWLAALLICLTGGYFPFLPELLTTVATVIIIVLLLLRDPTPLRRWLPGTLHAALWLSLLLTPVHFRLFPLALIFLVMAVDQPDPDWRNDLKMLSHLTFLLALLSPLSTVAQLQSCWHPLETILNRVLSLALPVGIDLSAAVSGIPLLLLFVIWWLVAGVSTVRWRALPGLLAVLLLYLAGLLLYLWNLPAAGRGISPWLPLLQFALLSLFCLPVFRRSSSKTKPVSNWRYLLLVLPLAGTLSLIWYTFAPPLIDINGVRIAVREEGDWAAISTRAGEEQGPRLGALLELARSFGATVDILPDSALGNLNGYDLFFLIHPVTPLDSNLVDHWSRWLRAGGGMLVVGDHTNIKNIQTGVNSFLAVDSHLRLRFDSAISTGLKMNWGNNQRYLLGPGSRALGNAPDFGISVGASVEALPPAFPLIQGIMAYSDRGDRTRAATGGMGNSRYTLDERFGSIELVGAERVGDGKLLLIGDTSGMMSLSIPLSWRWHLEMIDRLAGAPRYWSYQAVWWSWLLLLLGGMIAWFAGSLRQRQLLLLLCWLLLWQGYRLTEPRVVPPVHPERIGWIDHTHAANWDLVSRFNWSAAKLYELLYENDLQPLHLYELDASLVNGSRFLLLNGPVRSFNRRERGELHQFLADGNHLVLTVDARRAGALRSLQEELNFTVEELPLGTATVALQGGDTLDWHFYEAWPVACGTECDTLISAWGYPLAIRWRDGPGVVTLIGDHRFFSKQSLEGEERKGGQALATGSRYRNKPGRTQLTVKRPAREEWELEHRQQLLPHLLMAAGAQPENYTAKQAAALLLLKLEEKRQ
ncbi:hypothetical protein H8D51_00845 [bacterium]|nr:hypothetical protein [bacterium]